MKKPTRNKTLLMMIFSLTYDINTNTEHAAFFSFSGHVYTFDFKIAESKTLYLFDEKGDISIGYSNPESKETLKQIIADLEEFLKNATK